MRADFVPSTAATRAEGPAGCGLDGLVRWFLIFSKPGAEEIAKRNLERQGYRVYYPRLLRPALLRGRWVERIVAMFPRYLFVQVDCAHQSLGPVSSTLGVANVVRFGHEAAAVPSRIVDDLIAREDPGSGVHQLACRRPFRPGAQVSVIAGSFEGLDGVFERETGEERVVVLLRLLGSEVPVRIPSRFVVPSVA